MTNLISKEQPPSMYYVWQSEAYGQSHYYADLPCQIFSDRPMPCTPSGDFVADVPTARQAVEIVAQLGCRDLEAAKNYVQGALRGGV